MVRWVAISLISIVTFSACGPATTARGNERIQENVYLRKKRAIMDRLQGQFEGTMLDMRKGSHPVSVNLQLLSYSEIQPLPDRNDNIEIPSLAGVMATGRNDDGTVTAVFTTGYYHESTRRIQLMTYAVPMPTSPVVSPTVLQLTVVSYDHLVGRYISPQVIGTVDFTRVQE